MLESLIGNQTFCIIFWVVVFIIALIAELLTTELVSIWFCGGALTSFFTAVFNASFGVQAIVFVSVSAALLVFGRVFLIKKLNLNKSKTNTDALVGKEILITEPVAPRINGAGKYRDVVWTVVSDDVIAAGDYALITEISGNKLIVKKKEDK